MNIILTALAALALNAHADPGPAGASGFAAGIMAGSPTGGTVKYWVTPSHAFDMGLGFDGNLTLHMDYSWHTWDIFSKVKTGHLGAYFGVGPRFEFHDNGSTDFAIRTMIGASYILPRNPMEVFLEVGPTVQLAPDTSAGADVGLGLRFFLR